jgi:hypothetical protein
MPSSLKVQVEELGNALTALPERDRPFAQKLCDQFWQRGLSDKQAYWVGEMLTRAQNPDAGKPATTDVGSVKGVVELLERTAKHLKFPAVVVRANGRDIRLNIAGAKSKAPGSINVTSAVGGYGSREWYGRVTRDGQFEPSRKHDAATLTAVAAAVKAMAIDPAKAAAEYGHLTGCCCFCGIALTDERSTQIGYGPSCAKNYGLPWGKKVKAPTWDDPQLPLETQRVRRALSADEPSRRVKFSIGYGSQKIGEFEVE